MDTPLTRLEHIKAHADFAAQALQNALKSFGHDVTVEAAPNSLTVWCGTVYLGRAIYEEVACDGVVVAAARLIREWPRKIVDLG